jgi:hypothetical protein
MSLNEFKQFFDSLSSIVPHQVASLHKTRAQFHQHSHQLLCQYSYANPTGAQSVRDDRIF